jgi:hypothetical protein
LVKSIICVNPEWSFAKFFTIYRIGMIDVDVYLYYLIVGLSPFLCFFGIVIPSITTGIAYVIVVPVMSIFNKAISKKNLKTLLISLFILISMVSCISFLYFSFKDGIPPLD